MTVTQSYRFVQGALPCLLSLALLLPMPAFCVWRDATGLFDLLPGGRPDRSGLLKDWRISVGGWANAGISYNAEEPRDRYNGPVSFADRAGELQLNQLYLQTQRRIDVGGEDWDWGMRVDLMFGTDAGFTEARGDPDSHWDIDLTGDRFYHLAIPQAYGELFLPLGHGVKIKLGHFYTIVGSESITAPDNSFYTRSYATQHGEPFTHTGLLLNYRINDQLDFNVGAINGSATAGWDGAFDRSQDNVGFIGGFTLASEQGDSSLSINATHGSIRDPEPGDQNLVSAVLQKDLSTTLHWKLQHDYAWIATPSRRNNAEWYGIATYLTYDVEDTLSAALRIEWFRDDDGVRVSSPARVGRLVGLAANYFALTGGLTWQPLPWARLRPNLRYDWADNGTPFGNNTNSQILLSFDVLVIF